MKKEVTKKTLRTIQRTDGPFTLETLLDALITEVSKGTPRDSIVSVGGLVTNIMQVHTLYLEADD